MLFAVSKRIFNIRDVLSLDYHHKFLKLCRGFATNVNFFITFNNFKFIFNNSLFITIGL